MVMLAATAGLAIVCKWLLGLWATLAVSLDHQISLIFLIVFTKWTVRFLTFGGAGWLHKRRIEYDIAK